MNVKFLDFDNFIKKNVLVLGNIHNRWIWVGVYRSSLYYSCNFSISLIKHKFLLKENLIKPCEAKLTELQREMDESTIIDGDSNTPLSEMDRSSR